MTGRLNRPFASEFSIPSSLRLCDSVVNPPASADANAPLPPKTSERLLIDLWPETIGERNVDRVLTTSLGRAQLARYIAERNPQAAVECYYLDAYLLGLAQKSFDEDASQPRPENLAWRCSADLIEAPITDPAPGFDVVALPLTSRGDAELAREQLQQAYQALKPDGLLLASTDNPRDVWLHEILHDFGGKVRRYDGDDGAVYVVRRTGALKRERDFTSEFVFRDGEHLFTAVTRPGVFSHRRVDPGARRLMESMSITAGDRVLDIGCGWGAVGLAAAKRAEGVRVTSIDSNARAVACTRANAEHNGLSELLEAKLEPAGSCSEPGTYDVALANPPYYADFRIAEAFVQSAYAALRPGGTLLVVTKMPEWYHERLPVLFGEITSELVKNYTVFTAGKR